MRMLLAMFALAVVASSCNINRNIMFKTDRDYVYDKPYLDSSDAEYRLAANDIITFQLFTNEGAVILEFTASSNDRPRLYNFQDFTYPIDAEGYCDLPNIGRVPLGGLTINQAQDFLEEKYTPHFNFPYARVRVVNHRVIVFPGAGSAARVIPLVNQNTTIMEALAAAGGLADRADARKVKLIRKVGDKNEVYLLDLSTIEGVQYAQMTVQARDVLYVEPIPQLATEAMQNFSPFVSLISGLALIYAILTKGF